MEVVLSVLIVALSVLIVAVLLALAICRGRDVKFSAQCLGAGAYLEVTGPDRDSEPPDSQEATNDRWPWGS